MIILDRPFVSNFLWETIEKNKYIVVKTEFTKKSGFKGNSNLIDEESAIRLAKNSQYLKVYTSSENAFGWIAKNLPFSDLPQKVDLFKNKRKFRDLIKVLFPDYFYMEVLLDELKNLSLENIRMPFIIKPNVGFFSMGVYKVENTSQWESVLESIDREIAKIGHIYPKEVMNPESFIIEQVIEGDEYAIDAYYNSAGEPIILGIAKHLFASEEDVSDRVYISSKEIIEDCHDQFHHFLVELGELGGLKNFPIHVELRKDEAERIIPIEVNPLRFGGWCTTADMNYFAYGFNPYEHYFAEKKPDWKEILKDKNGLLYSVIVLDNSSGIDGKDIKVFDYEKLHSTFENVLEIRKIDYKEYPLFGFVFTETREENIEELKYILKSDLREFIKTKD